MAKGKAKLDEVKLELTPMIDVTFLLLIFFMVSMKFKVLEGKLQTELPKDVGVNAGEAILMEKMEIGIFNDPSREQGIRVTLNSRPMPNMATFRSQLKTYVELDPEQKATLYPDAAVNYEQVVKVVDQCLQADLTNITFAGTTFDA
jgi:biopolymer transport protein ExbD